MYKIHKNGFISYIYIYIFYFTLCICQGWKGSWWCGSYQPPIVHLQGPVGCLGANPGRAIRTVKGPGKNPTCSPQTPRDLGDVRGGTELPRSVLRALR